MKKIWIILFILLPPAACLYRAVRRRYELGLTEVTGALMEFVRSGVMSIAGGRRRRRVRGFRRQCGMLRCGDGTTSSPPDCGCFLSARRFPPAVRHIRVFSQSAGESRTSWSQRRAGFGAALAILLFGGGSASYFFAFAFGVGAVLLSYWIAGIYKSVPAIMLVLGGTIVTSMFNALVSLLKYVADTDSQLPAIVYWLMGSLASVGWNSIWAIIPVGIGLVVLVCCGWRINVLSMGERKPVRWASMSDR